MSGITLEEITSGQEKQLTRVIMDMLEKSGRKDKDSVNRILARGDELKRVLLPAFQRLGAEVQLVNSHLLEPVSTVDFPAATVMPSRLENGKVEEGVNLWLGGNAESLLRGYSSTIEAQATEGRIHRLRKGSVDKPILAELGGEEAARLSFANMWGLVLAQSQSQPGPLLVNGYSNVFYPEEFPGWAFYFRWCAGPRGWHLQSYPVASADRWDAYSRFFSR